MTTNVNSLEFVLSMVEAQLQGGKTVQNSVKDDASLTPAYINGYVNATQDILDMIKRTIARGE